MKIKTFDTWFIEVGGLQLPKMSISVYTYAEFTCAFFGSKKNTTLKKNPSKNKNVVGNVGGV